MTELILSEHEPGFWNRHSV